MKRMRLKSNNFFKSFGSVSRTTSLGKWLSVGLVSSLFLAACASETDEVPFGQVGFVSGFYGAVSGDEPASVLIGRDVLTSGGNAADAAVALAFSMAVTYQSEVSLGAGGMCVVHDGQSGSTEILDFVGASATGTSGQYQVAIPGFVRGMAALNLQYGNLDWRELLVPAERQARFGYRLSRAQDRKTQSFKAKLARDLESRRKLADDNGRIYREGQIVDNPELAVALGRIRIGGAGQFYVGEYARNIVRAAQANGANLTLRDLNDFIPQWRNPVSVQMGSDFLMTTPAPAAGGMTLAGMVSLFHGDERYADLENNSAQKQALALKAYAASIRGQKAFYAKNGMHSDQDSLFPNRNGLEAQFKGQTQKAEAPLGGGAGAGFLVVDQQGMAVACNIGMNDHFGTGKMVPELGFYLSRMPDKASINSYAFGPMVVSRGELRGGFLYASVASGGPAAAQILANVMAEQLMNGEKQQSLEEIVASPRLAITSDNQVTAEVSASSDAVRNLASQGYNVGRGDLGVRLHAVHCPLSLPTDEANDAFCLVANDPRGHGLSESLLPNAN